MGLLLSVISQIIEKQAERKGFNVENMAEVPTKEKMQNFYNNSRKKLKEGFSDVGAVYNFLNDCVNSTVILFPTAKEDYLLATTN